MTSEKKGRGIFELWMLMAVFGIPMLIGWMLYLNPGWLPEGRKNLGELVDPQRHWPDELVLQTTEGKSFGKANLLDFWTLVWVGSSECGDACIEGAYQMRQLRKALADNASRVQRLLVLRAPAKGIEKLPEAFEGTEVVILNDAQWAEVQPLLFAESNDAEGHRYVMDPLQNLMMHYTPEQSLEEWLKDMTHLLKVNRWGPGH
jgi:hypothetical protein